MSTLAKLDTSLKRLEKAQRLPLIARGPFSGLAYALAKVCHQSFLDSSGSLLLIIAESNEKAEELKDAMSLFLSSKERENIEILPGMEQSPYLHQKPSLQIRQQRVRALNRLLQGESTIFIASAQGALQKTPPPQTLLSKQVSLTKGEECPIEDARELLTECGYIEVEEVEDPGTFSTRGGILDLYSPKDRFPTRLEYFDDEIESIRYFDPQTQMSFRPSSHEGPDPLQAPETVVATATRELPLDSETIQRAKRKIKTWCDEKGIPKQKRDPIFDSLDRGVYLNQIDLLLPFLFENKDLNTALEYFDKSKTKLITIDIPQCENNIDRLQENWNKDFQIAMDRQEIAAKPDEILSPWQDFQKAKAHFAQIEIEKVLLHEHGLEKNDQKAIHSAINPIHLKTFSLNRLKIDLTKESPFKEAAHEIKQAVDKGIRVVFVANTQSQIDRFHYIAETNNLPCFKKSFEEWGSLLKQPTGSVLSFLGHLSEGFELPDDQLLVISENDLFGKKKSTPVKKKDEKAFKHFLEQAQEFSPGDYIVHETHGVGVYRGLVKLSSEKEQNDYLHLEYASGDKLYLPVHKMDLIQKYSGGAAKVAVHKLGGQQFEKTKSRVRSEVKKLAIDLIDLYAKRKAKKGYAFSEPDEAFREFEAQFPFTETPDQASAIEDVLKDMQAEKPMDRLICGDVGFGKTEVAMRAAYKAILDGKQVAVLVPTTILAEQHFQTFEKRFQDTGVQIASLSRLRSTKEMNEIKAKIQEGKLDLIIGTHRLLNKKIKWNDLGLVIIDEEQRFGVEHKETLKLFRESLDILTLTATPIPRTLHMSFIGLRDISLIQTPPVDRLSIRTYLIEKDNELIRRSIDNELRRDGQVFVLHNRVQSIDRVANELKELVPEAKIVVAHGQLKEKDLEKRMYDFYQKKFNVLVATTIIESGLDIPSANTMVVDRADTYGLAQLYQLRGRIGRSQERAYCYLVVPSLNQVTGEARERLSVLQNFAELGSGFQIANYDLEIRGAGDILGGSQSGHIASVGLDLYMELLDQAIKELQGQEHEEAYDPEIKIPVSAYLPDFYIQSTKQRLQLYKRVSDAKSESQLLSMESEMRDRFGPLPEEAQHLFWLVRIKILLKNYRIHSFTAGPRSMRMLFQAEDKKVQPLVDKVMNLMKNAPAGSVQLSPEGKIVLGFKAKSSLPTPKEVYFSLVNHLRLDPSNEKDEEKKSPQGPSIAPIA